MIAEQAPQQFQQPVSQGNPQAAMQFMPQIPMATYNPMMMDQALIEEQMLMQQAPPEDFFTKEKMALLDFGHQVED